MLRRRNTLSRSSRRGQVVVLVAVCLPALLGIVAIATDGGLLLDNRRRAQAAADAAALAAAADLYANFATNAGLDPSGTAKAAALANAATNGYANDGTRSVVTINVPPLSGDHIDQPGYVEVTVLYNQPRGFSGIFGSGDLPVQARAVARGRYRKVGVLVLDPAQQWALRVKGGSLLNVPDAAVVVDSNNTEAAHGDSSGKLFAAEVNITGENPGYTVVGGASFDTPQGQRGILTGEPPTPDPLRDLPPPDPNSLTLRYDNPGKPLSFPNTYTPITLSPGVYRGGIQIAGGKVNVTLLPGIYYMDGGGFGVASGAKVTGNGVMIYNAPKDPAKDLITMDGAAGLTLSPPTSGPYKDISIFQDRNSTATVSLQGNTQTMITGIFYAAKALTDVASSGDLTVANQVITGTLLVQGGGTFNIPWNGGAPVRLYGLVE